MTEIIGGPRKDDKYNKKAIGKRPIRKKQTITKSLYKTGLAGEERE